ncbi:MAG: tRNA (adenosine(37)-N6)-threonylcarbamoyltransferase complex ATPase subunit type 1 TsaE [Flavobacteriales bacterium]|nr:tRNA (adenosine(37)-N6)-threonylcarbamoyltransferase complex ATPase subunit type 1 TsaE [Flavobacteriales bacterium]
MLNTLTIRTPSQVPDTARLILDGYPEHRVFALNGDLGAGKTTLIKGFCDALGVHDQASSPTFSIVNEYRSEHGGPVYHFDLYRLKDAEELQGIGFTEYIDSGAYCFIEWPELAADLLPVDALQLLMEVKPNGCRTITVTR